MKNNRIWILIGCAALFILCVVPLIVTTRYIMHLFNLAVIFAILTLGLNFLWGWTGLISFATAGFWGIGAYTSALLAVNLGVPFWLGLPCGAITATVFGFIMGFPTLKLRGHYLAMATLAFNIIIVLVLINWDSFTRGGDGITGIPIPVIGSFEFNTDNRFFYINLAVLVLLFIGAMRIRKSRIGRAFEAIRESEIAGEVMGINTHAIKILAFALSAFYSGIAGSLYAHVTMYISPDIFNFLESVKILVMVLIGGSGSIVGALIGGFILTFLPEALRFLSSWYMAIYGVGIIVLIVYMPAGITGLINSLFKRFGRGDLVIPI
ncbi:MAG: branched-chain amino acid ABC transporter permease [Thermodesulfobacteriota bacterium]|jgi:branched-chain amino acid transport system permease protein